MRKNAAIILFVVFLLILFIPKNHGYDFKITIQTQNLDSKTTDLILAKEIKNNLCQIKQISDVATVSSDTSCNIYCKLKDYSKKEHVLPKISAKLQNCGVSNYLIDEEYDKKIDGFLVILPKSKDYKALKIFCDDVLDKLLVLNLSEKIELLGLQTNSAYIYFNNFSLQKYDLDISNIKEIISKNNIFETASSKSSNEKYYQEQMNGRYETIFDLKNTPVYYLEGSFSTTFDDVFEIREEAKTPFEYSISLDNREAVIFFLAKKRMYPKFLFNLKIRKLAKSFENSSYELKYIDTSRLDKITVYFSENQSYNKTKEQSEKISSLIKSENILFLNGLLCPNIKGRSDFFEKERNALTILAPSYKTRKIRKILSKNGYKTKEGLRHKIILEEDDLDKLYLKIQNYKNAINFTTQKAMQIKYELDNYSLNDYYIDKKEVLDSINANTDGLEAGYYFEGSTKIPILLQNKDDEIFIYSKKTKSLIPLSAVAKTSLETDYLRIVRKNDKFYAKLYTK